MKRSHTRVHTHVYNTHTHAFERATTTTPHSTAAEHGPTLTSRRADPAKATVAAAAAVVDADAAPRIICVFTGRLIASHRVHARIVPTRVDRKCNDAAARIHITGARRHCTRALISSPRRRQNSCCSCVTRLRVRATPIHIMHSRELDVLIKHSQAPARPHHTRRGLAPRVYF